MKRALWGLAWAMMVFGCEGGGDATCAVCGTSFSDSQCMQIAVAQGCASGVSEPDGLCGGDTRGCRLRGCPAGRPIRCEITGADAGP